MPQYLRAVMYWPIPNCTCAQLNLRITGKGEARARFKLRWNEEPGHDWLLLAPIKLSQRHVSFTLLLSEFDALLPHLTIIPYTMASKEVSEDSFMPHVWTKQDQYLRLSTEDTVNVLTRWHVVLLFRAWELSNPKCFCLLPCIVLFQYLKHAKCLQ